MFYNAEYERIENEKRSCFVKIILKKNDNFDLALRKRRFYRPKAALLPCKTYAFGMQNNRFCNTLTMRWLGESYCCEKCLHFSCLFFTYTIKYIGEIVWRKKLRFLVGKVK
ncbi:hypothetical protein CTM62_03270 [Prevotella intermedia]|uniref:Uncharacterized protein n=1 Tax=Prevotella intermedia TaxID=28131 RepID=A0A2D3L5I6_PREIN|nr:hypothetical protein CTM62_03270 [Prevotella intermedia]